MQNIYFGPDERAHQKFLDFFYIVCGLLCLALAILSLFPAGQVAVLSADLFYSRRY